MANIKFFLFILLTFIARIAFAQYSVGQEGDFQINHYACKDSGKKIVVYEHLSPKDFCDALFFNCEVYECYFNNNHLIVKFRCSDDGFGRYNLMKKSDMDTNLCVCEECLTAFQNNDTVLLSVYYPLKNIEVYLPTKVNKTTLINKTRYPASHTIFATISKRKIRRITMVPNKCIYSSCISPKKGHWYLYLTHSDYQVSELLEIVTPPTFSSKSY